MVVLMVYDNVTISLMEWYYPRPSTRHAREIIEAWRKDYNAVRLHTSLGGLTPEEFVKSTARL